MRHQQLRLGVALLFGLGMTGLQAQNLYVKQQSGTQTVYTISNIQKMSFSSGNLNIAKKDNSNGVYALSGLRYVNFVELFNAIDEVVMAPQSILNIYPNPVINTLSVDLADMVGKAGVITIYSLDGKVMKTQNTLGESVVKLDLTALPQGIYFCRYHNGGETKIAKIIK